MKIIDRIKQGSKKIPKVNYLVIWLFAGHGVLRNGMQTILFNELDKRNGYYKMFNCEAVIRDIAAKYSNSYMITIFACCRQLYNP